MDTVEPSAPEPTLDLANEAIRERLVSQKEAIERIETKITLLLGFAAVALQLVVRGGFTQGSTFTSSTMSSTPPLTYV